MKRFFVILLIALLTIGLFSCGGSGSANEGGSSNDNNGGYMPGGDVTSTPEVPEMKLIYEAYIDIDVEAYNECISAIKKEVTESNGYISSLRENIDGEYKNASLVIRIPTENYNKVKDDIATLGKVTYSNHSVVDVTNNYIDIEARLESLRAQKTALDAMLAKAENVSTMLEIQKEISNVSYEIESYQKQLNSYDNRIAYSTINLSITECGAIVEESENAFVRIGNNFVSCVKVIWNVIVEIFVFVIGYLPVFIIIGGVVVLVIFLRKRKKK